jgi:hypothetical protein
MFGFEPLPEFLHQYHCILKTLRVFDSNSELPHEGTFKVEKPSLAQGLVADFPQVFQVAFHY